MFSGSSTFKPYDPTETIGDLTPATPQPGRHRGRGVMGRAAITAVAIAVALPHIEAFPGASGGRVRGGDYSRISRLS